MASPRVKENMGFFFRDKQYAFSMGRQSEIHHDYSIRWFIWAFNGFLHEFTGIGEEE